MAITTRKELAEVIVIPSHPLSGGVFEQNVVKRVTYNVITFDDTKTDIEVISSIVSTLSEQDLNDGNYIVATENNGYEILQWATENIDGDAYYNDNLKENAESQLNSLLEFSGTSFLDLDNIQVIQPEPESEPEGSGPGGPPGV